MMIMWEKWHTEYNSHVQCRHTLTLLCARRLGIVNLLCCVIHSHSHIHMTRPINTFSTAKFSVLVYGTIDESKFYKHPKPNSNLQINKTTSEEKMRERKRKKNGFKSKVMKFGTWKKGDNLKLFDSTCCVWECVSVCALISIPVYLYLNLSKHVLDKPAKQLFPSIKCALLL